MRTQTQGLNTVFLFCPVVDCKSDHNPPPSPPSARLEEISSHVLKALICSCNKKLFSLHLAVSVFQKPDPFLLNLAINSSFAVYSHLRGGGSWFKRSLKEDCKCISLWLSLSQQEFEDFLDIYIYIFLLSFKSQLWFSAHNVISIMGHFLLKPAACMLLFSLNSSSEHQGCPMGLRMNHIRVSTSRTMLRVQQLNKQNFTSTKASSL